MQRPVVLHVVGTCRPDDPTAWLISSTTAHRPFVVLTDPAAHLPPGPAPDLRQVSIHLLPTGAADRLLVGRVLAKAGWLGWKTRPSLVHAHSFAVAPLAAALARCLHRPWLLTITDPDLSTTEQAIAAEADLLLAPQPVAARLAATRSGSGERICALPVTAELGSRAADLDSIYRAVANGKSPVLPAVQTDWQPSVSVIVPTYNRRDLLTRTLDALDAQTYSHRLMQVIVVDDQSTDDSTTLVQSRQTDYELVLVRPVSKGYAAGARNSGLAVATGEVVAFTDDDCRPEPTWLAGLIAGFREGIDLVQGRTIADPEQPIGPRSRSQWTPSEYGLYETANIAYRRAALDAAGSPVFDPGIPAALVDLLGERLGSQAFGEDSELAWRVRRHGGQTRFAADAVVRHHVFERARRYVLRRAILTAGFPMLAARVPELRTEFFWARYFLNRRHALTTLAGAGLAMTPVFSPAAIAVAPYLNAALRPLHPGLRSRIGELPLYVARDAIEVMSCVYGSVRAKTLVL